MVTVAERYRAYVAIFNLCTWVRGGVEGRVWGYILFGNQVNFVFETVLAGAWRPAGGLEIEKVWW